MYVSDGLGKSRTEDIAGYPLEVAGSALQHVVTSLEPLVPYDVQLVAGNVAGCGEPVTSQPFFTREGAPEIPPHNVKVERLNGTAMNVSFTRLSIVEARSISATYTVRYSPQTSRKRQERAATVPDGQSHVVIEGLDPDITYNVVVVVDNNEGVATAERMVVPPPPPPPSSPPLPSDSTDPEITDNSPVSADDTSSGLGVAIAAGIAAGTVIIVVLIVSMTMIIVVITVAVVKYRHANITQDEPKPPTPSSDGVYASIEPIPAEPCAMKCEGGGMETTFSQPQPPPEWEERYDVPRPSMRQVVTSPPPTSEGKEKQSESLYETVF